MNRKLLFALLLLPAALMFVYGGMFVAKDGMTLFSSGRLTGLALIVIGGAVLIRSADNTRRTRQNRDTVLVTIMAWSGLLLGAMLCIHFGWAQSLYLAASIVFFTGLCCLQVDTALKVVPKLLVTEPVDEPQEVAVETYDYDSSNQSASRTDDSGIDIFN